MVSRPSFKAPTAPGIWACWCIAAGIGLAAAMPAGCAEFRAMPVPLEPEPPGGRVELAPGESLTAQALEHALRADAARRWQRSDGGSGLSVRLEAVTWRDGSLGCPLSDRHYTQALVKGWRALVGDGVHEAHYHASGSGSWLLCPAALVQPPLPDDALR